MQVKTTGRYYDHPLEWLKLKTDLSQSSKMEKLKLSSAAGRNGKGKTMKNSGGDF